MLLLHLQRSAHLPYIPGDYTFFDNHPGQYLGPYTVDVVSGPALAATPEPSAWLLAITGPLILLLLRPRSNGAAL